MYYVRFQFCFKETTIDLHSCMEDFCETPSLDFMVGFFFPSEIIWKYFLVCLQLLDKNEIKLRDYKYACASFFYSL